MYKSITSFIVVFILLTSFDVALIAQTKAPHISLRDSVLRNQIGFQDRGRYAKPHELRGKTKEHSERAALGNNLRSKQKMFNKAVRLQEDSERLSPLSRRFPSYKERKAVQKDVPASAGMKKPSLPFTPSDSVQENWVRHYASGLIPSTDDDYASAIAVDADGNVYVTGTSYSSSTGDDYATIKYNSSGVEQWVSRYNGAGNGDDFARAIAVDADGNVYVTGTSYSSGSGDDYATIKYNSSGVEQWVSRYNGAGNGDDFARAISVDAGGNVYVTGTSYGSGTNFDYATIKYNSSGVEQWVSRYHEPDNSWDYARAIAVDSGGNVYVTGNSYGSGASYDYATIKYNSSGAAQWVSRYNGPGNSYDFVSAIAVDAGGNVYVTGNSYDSVTRYDYATIKYNSSGAEQWVFRYNGPDNDYDEAYAIAVDAGGNVYVTGTSYGSVTRYDYATIKYNSSGDEQWVSRYNGPDNDTDGAFAIAVDAGGNVYVTGKSYGSVTGDDYATIKYNSSGAEQWVFRYNGPDNDYDEAFAIAVDAGGNVYVTGKSYGSGTYYDYATIKYNSSGAEQWVSRYNGPGNSWDYAYAIAVDAGGNVYVTGDSYSGNNYDYATIKYNSSGVEQWVSRYNGPDNDCDFASAIAVDADGNVYVTGKSYGSATGSDYATIKYNSSGVEQWVSRYNGAGNGDDFARAISVDAGGNVYVTGTSYGSGTNFDYATIKYNSSGVEQWVSRYNEPDNSWDYARAIAVDSGGNVYVTGNSYGSGASYDYATIKYNSSGVEQWVSRYDGPCNISDYASAIAVDSGGNVYITGYSYGSGTNYDYATIKYNSSGDEQWVSRYDGPDNNYDQAYAIAVDAGDNVYVTGYSYGSGTGYDYATIKYNSSGAEQWVSRYNGPGNRSDYAYAIAVDAGGNVYVTGYSYGSDTGSDYATIKYNSSGVEQWVSRYNGPGNENDEASAITVDADGNVYVTGYTEAGETTQYTTIKYTQVTTSVKPEGRAAGMPEKYSLNQNYPNPFNPTTMISFSIPSKSFVSLKIFDALGREVAILISEQLAAGSYMKQWNAAGLPSGVYFYRLVANAIPSEQAGSFIDTKKIILLR